MKIIKIMLLLLLVFTLGGCKSLKRQITQQREVKFNVDMKSAKLPIGTVETQLDRSLLGLKKTNASVTYFPVEDAVCLEFKRNTVTNYQFWNRPARTAFIKALESYIEEFDERELIRNRSTITKYGGEEGFIVWKASRVSAEYKTNVDFNLGYSFKDGSPFFVVKQGEAVYEDIFATNSNEKYITNGEFMMFYTRAQAMELAAYFDQQFLRSHTNLRDPASIDPNVRYEVY